MLQTALTPHTPVRWEFPLHSALPISPPRCERNASASRRKPFANRCLPPQSCPRTTRRSILVRSWFRRSHATTPRPRRPNGPLLAICRRACACRPGEQESMVEIRRTGGALLLEAIVSGNRPLDHQGELVGDCANLRRVVCHNTSLSRGRTPPSSASASRRVELSFGGSLRLRRGRTLIQFAPVRLAKGLEGHADRRRVRVGAGTLPAGGLPSSVGSKDLLHNRE